MVVVVDVVVVVWERSLTFDVTKKKLLILLMCLTLAQVRLASRVRYVNPKSLGHG